MFKRILSVMFAALGLLVLAGCAAPMQGQSNGQPYTYNDQPNRGQPHNSAPSESKQRMEESVIPSAGARDSCRLRQNGKVLAETAVPEGIRGEDAKRFCGTWQRKEAAARGLI